MQALLQHTSALAGHTSQPTKQVSCTTNNIFQIARYAEHACCSQRRLQEKLGPRSRCQLTLVARAGISQAGSALGAETSGDRFPAQLADWSEQVVWEAALQAAAGSEPSSLAALRRGLDGLHLLLPDLEPHWREQMGVHRRLIGVEALLRGLAPPPPLIPGGGGQPAASSSSSPSSSSSDVCLYSEAQRAAQELQGLAGFVRQYGNRATDSCYQHAVWVLTEALMGAARNYCGPGSTLLRAGDLAGAATAVVALRRAHEAHLSALIRLQVQLAMRLPEVTTRLVQIRTETADKGLDVSRLVATNLGLLLDLTLGPGGTTATPGTTRTTGQSLAWPEASAHEGRES